MSTNSQHKLSQVRKPRVHITYDMQIGDDTEERELPFVAGVFADLFGHNKDDRKKYTERKFTHVDKNSFDKFMQDVKPKLGFSIKDPLGTDQNAKTRVEIEFSGMKDFNPDNFVKQSEQMGALLKKRQLLSELLCKLDGNDALINLLVESLKDSTKAKELAEIK